MELAIPILALGGLFVMNSQRSKSKKKDIYLTQQKETFENMGKKANYLPNTDIPPQNYPVINDAQLVDTVQEYPNPNQATDKYFNQNYFEEQNRMNKKTGQNIQDVYSLTGDYLKTEEFTHNNMVPFYGAKMKGGNYKNEDAQIFLDNMSGAGSQIYNKVEQAPLFKPEDNVQWAYGTPVMSEFYQSRVNPGMNNNNVKPFDSINVGPGLNQGFSSEGSNGYNSGMEVRNLWIDKNVDELRIATNPKESFSLINHEGPAESKITNVGKIGVMEKNRPDTFFINTQDRWLTTTGEQKGNRLVPIEMVNETNRNSTTSQFMGPASAQLKTASYTPINYEESKRNELESFDKYPTHSYGGNKGLSENHLSSMTIEKNNRSSCNQQPALGASFNRSIGAVLLPFMDMLKPTRKEEYDCNVRVFGNAGSSVPKNILELNQKVSPTIKESTLYAPHSYIQRQAGGGGYLSSEQTPTNTQRMTTGETCYMSTPGGSATSYGETLYNSHYIQTNNDKKEDTLCGRTNQGNLNLFTGNTNVAVHNKEKNCTYMGTPGLINGLAPSIQSYGKVNHNPCDSQTYNLDRIQPDLLNAFKENPYTHSLTSAV